MGNWPCVWEDCRKNTEKKRRPGVSALYLKGLATYSAISYTRRNDVAT